jgi:4-hydroxybenzoyl-CoA thioesterase
MRFGKMIKVCFGDIDNAGIVYYPRFMHYFHLAMEEFFGSELGIDYAEVLHKRNLSLPTVHLQADFRRRLRYGDQINIEVKVIDIGRTSITWGYEGYRVRDVGEIAVEGQNVTVCVETETFEKREVPEWLKKGLTAYMERSEKEGSDGSLSRR